MTGKVEISEEVRNDVEMIYLHSNVSVMENNKISMVINLDQIQLKYVPGCNKTLAPTGIKSVSVAGSTDKRTITAAFSITIDGKFYRCRSSTKTSKSIPPVSFLDSFLVSANKKHYSNEKESLKMLEQIIIPYVKKQRENLSLDPRYPTLLIINVFKGQVTKQLKDLLNENNIKLQKVPANLTYLFQPLDVQGGPNGHAKRFMKNKFTLWYADQIKSELDKGKKVEEINISMKLSVLKPLHA